MKKLLLIIIVIGIALFNYKLISFNGGFKVASIGVSSDNAPILTQVTYILDIKNIYYYDNPLASDYIVVIDSESKGLEVGRASLNEINNLDSASLLIKNIKPQKITTIPIYAYFIAIIIIYLYPRRNRKY